MTFTRTSPSKAARLYFREDEKPLPSNPYFYRVGDRLYFLGTETLNLSSVELGLKTSFDPTDVNMDIDQDFEFPQDLLPLLKRQILDMGRFVLQVPEDLLNDGSGQVKPLPTQKLISVNPQTEENGS